MAENIIKYQIEKFLNRNIDNIETDLLQLLAIKSVAAEPEANAPFGQSINLALDKVVAIAEKLGLSAENHGGYYATVDLYGKPEPHQAVGILTHIDVVPLGEGWSYNPLGQIIGDKIYGRGAIDDKGPTVAILYAMAALKQLHIPLSRPVRLVVGGNEESGSRCIEKYKSENIPLWGGFSPDANFPVIHAEKGITHLLACKAATSEVIKELSGGMVANAVPGKAVAIIAPEYQEELKALLAKGGDSQSIGLELLSEGEHAGCLRLTAIGKSAHAANPEKGRSAIKLLLAIIGKLSYQDELKTALQDAYELFAADYDGIGCGIATKDEVSGPLTLSLGIISYKGKRLDCTLDLRYPVTADYAAILTQLRAAATAKGFDVHEKEHQPPLHVPKDSPLVERLLAIYHQEVSPTAEPIAIGGGTYCRALENFVAFGAVFIAHEDTMHQADEYIGRDHLQVITQIYAKAILELAKY